MTFGNAVLTTFTATNGVLDKLILETSIPKSDRDILSAYKAKGAAMSTRKDEDSRVLDILTTWAIQRHRITA